MKPEEKARQSIDELLTDAGWAIQDYQSLNLGASLGVAIREFVLPTGLADYLLFIDRKAVGVIEAKPEGTTLGGVELQSDKYAKGFPESIPHIEPIPFFYESTGIETMFRDRRDPDPRSRPVFAFHTPETLANWLSQPDTLRSRLKAIPPLHKEGLRDCQIEAIENLERSFSVNHPRALIQMASGSGKTYTAVSFVYRLIKFAKAKRILFLVDRNSLAKQTEGEFRQYRTPDDGRKFTELYNVQRLTSNNLDLVNNVCITTIQRLYAMLMNQELEEESEEPSLFEVNPVGQAPKEVQYNPKFPIDTFDFIITDECHRSIYNLWRQVLEYFDAFIIGLTATPSKQTLGFFKQNLVMEYGHDRAVVDGVNVPYNVYRIKTQITEKGSIIEAGYYIDKRNKLTRKLRWEQLDDELEYTQKQLDRDVVAEDQIRTVVRTFKENLFKEIFPNRKEVPKTLIFAKDDSHAEDIVRIVREEFGKGNDFCKKITYKTMGEKPLELLQSFRISYYPRITVTVDMISTGTDIRPLECLIFLRDVRSRVYFEQMKGRGTRTISSTDFRSVAPDALNKTQFIIVDAVGVTESDKTDTRPLEKKISVPFDKLLESIAIGIRDPDSISSLAARLARLDREMDEQEKLELETITSGLTIKSIANQLLDSIDPDKVNAKAKELFNTEEPNPSQYEQASKELVDHACLPFDNHEVRRALTEIKSRIEQIIDTISKDRVISAGFDKGAVDRDKKVISDFKEFIEKNKNELLALQIIYEQPYRKRQLTYESIKQLAETIRKPPYYLSSEEIWNAYERLEKSKVRNAGPQRLLTDIISLVRYASGQADVLEPYSAIVGQRFEEWINVQRNMGLAFTKEQMDWLLMIKDHISTSLSISIDDFENVPFNQKGGAINAYQVFGGQLNSILIALNEALAV